MDDKGPTAVTAQPTSPMSAIRRMSASHHEPVDVVGQNNELEQMGYQQEMKRTLGLWSTLGLAFAIMAGTSRFHAPRGGRRNQRCSTAENRDG